MPGQKLHIDAEKAHEPAAMSAASTTSYVLLAFKYLPVLVGILQGIATGVLDQHVNGVHVGKDIYDGEITWKKRAPGAPAPSG